MARRSLKAAALILAALMVACLLTPEAAYGGDDEDGVEDGVLGIRADLETIRVGMRGTAADRIGMIAALLEQRSEEAGAAAGVLTQWVLGRTERLSELAHLEAERGERRGEDLVEAMAALERATTRARERLGELMEHVPQQAREALQRCLQAMERGRHLALDVLAGVAAGERPGAPDEARAHLERARGGEDRPDPGPAGEGAGGAGRPGTPEPPKTGPGGS